MFTILDHMNLLLTALYYSRPLIQLSIIVRYTYFGNAASSSALWFPRSLNHGQNCRTGQWEQKLNMEYRGIDCHLAEILSLRKWNISVWGEQSWGVGPPVRHFGNTPILCETVQARLMAAPGKLQNSLPTIQSSLRTTSLSWSICCIENSVPIMLIGNL